MPFSSVQSRGGVWNEFAKTWGKFAKTWATLVGFICRAASDTRACVGLDLYVCVAPYTHTYTMSNQHIQDIACIRFPFYYMKGE